MFIYISGSMDLLTDKSMKRINYMRVEIINKEKVMRKIESRQCNEFSNKLTE